MVAFGEFLYASNYSQSYLNAQPLSNESYGGVVVPSTNAPYNPFGQTRSTGDEQFDQRVTGEAQVEVANRFVDQPAYLPPGHRLLAGGRGIEG